MLQHGVDRVSWENDNTGKPIPKAIVEQIFNIISYLADYFVSEQKVSRDQPGPRGDDTHLGKAEE